VAPTPPLTPDNLPQSEHYFSAGLKGRLKQKAKHNVIPASEPESYNDSHSPDSGSTAGMTVVSFDRPFLGYFFWVNKMK